MYQVQNISAPFRECTDAIKMNHLFSKLTVIFLIVIQHVAGNELLVKVKQGWLEGEKLDYVTGDGKYYSFKGIPYAQPPNGTLRFKAPLPPLTWTGVRNAKQHGSRCPHLDILSNTLILGQEDCLFLNVYSPNLKPSHRLPVIVFIHGGLYKSGSGNVDFHGPDFLVRKNMILVTLNYRLDALGFISLGTEEVPGNAGLKDQNAALKWVKKNIKYFGGDADRVTIMGQSAGSASVALHISSPMSKGLFQRAIALSGAPLNDWSLPFHPEKRAFVLGKILGFETQDPDALLEFLQSVPSEQLINTSPNILSSEEYTNNILKMNRFVPVIEKYRGKNNFLSYNAFEEPALINEVDVLFGHTNQEIVALIEPIRSTLIEQYGKYPELLVPTKILNQLEPNHILELSDEIRKYYFGNKSININSTKEFVKHANYLTFVYDILKYFMRLPQTNNTVRYSYQFSITSRRNYYGLQGEKYDIFGAAHFDDLMYYFDPKSLNLTSDKDSVEIQLIDQLTTLLTDFAKYGNPLHSLNYHITWPMFNKSTKQFVDLSNNGSQVTATVLSVNDDENFNFWEQLYAFN